jgi:predicted alpha-1,6-mannanase (GH76 family)
MRHRRLWCVLVAMIAGLASTGCSSQAPSDVPAVDALVGFYDQRAGVWPTTGWWNSANALTALTDYMISTGDHRYSWVVANTYQQKRNAAQGNFINDFVDDTGWWALAWIRAYDLTGDHRYLTTAQRGVDFMWRYHDDVCGGGLWWTVNREYKNAIASELFVKAAAELDTRLGGGTPYRDRAVSVWNWFNASGLINDDLLINDGLQTGSCRNNGATAWTYNQGVVLGALVALARSTGDDSYLDRARELADASATSAALHVDGVLTEPCEASGCDVNGTSFKGIYVRNLGELDRALTDHPYRGYLVDQATVAYEKNRTPDSEYGLHWAGPIDRINGATQQSAVDLLVAAQPITDEPSTSSSGRGDDSAG